MTMRVFIAGSAALFLVNCSGATDPADANLFDNIVNNQEGGVYDQQIAANRAEAEALRLNNSQTQSRIGSLEAQRSSNAQTISALTNEAAALRAEISQTRARVASDPAKVEQLVALDKQVVAVQRDVEAGGDPSVARRELSQIRATIRQVSS